MARDRLTGFTALFGATAWKNRVAAIRGQCTPTHAGRALAAHHAFELILDGLRAAAPQTSIERRLAALATGLVDLARGLPPPGRDRLRAACAAALHGNATLVPLLHLVRTAALQRARGFAVHEAGLADGAGFDLLGRRDGHEVEIVCDTMSAEAGRDLHRQAWSLLLDRIDPDLQAWLAAHPGRYLLKMTLPQGLKAGGDAALAALHTRITAMLRQQRRADQDEAAVLRLDPLMLAGAQAPDGGLLPSLRQAFGPEAHLAVTQAGRAVIAMAARAAREDDIAEAVQRRLRAIAPARFTGDRPGILAMLLEDTDRLEWRALRDQLRLEGEVRQFLTRPEARSVVAVTCCSRLELCTEAGEDIRFRNPSHPRAREAALAPAITSLA